MELTAEKKQELETAINKVAALRGLNVTKVNYTKKSVIVLTRCNNKEYTNYPFFRVVCIFFVITTC